MSDCWAKRFWMGSLLVTEREISATASVIASVASCEGSTLATPSRIFAHAGAASMIALRTLFRSGSASATRSFTSLRDP